MLHIGFEFRKGILFIRLFGELTKKTIHKLKREIKEMIESSGIFNIVISLQGIIRIDHAGMNVLYKIYNKINENGNFMICNSDSKIVENFINKSILSKHISILESEVDAFKLITV